MIHRPLDREARRRLGQGVGRRHGIVLPPAIVGRRPADPDGIVHASVAAEGTIGISSAGGGAARTTLGAENAAIAEALERYAAANAVIDVRQPHQLPVGADALTFDDFSLHSVDQRAQPDYPFRDLPVEGDPLAPVVELSTGRQVWVPAGLVALRPDLGAASTSNGLAADWSLYRALLRGAQELVERDALMATWLHGVAGREVGVDNTELSRADGMAIRAFDLTPHFSPHPVCLVAAEMPLLGRPRIGVGLACRSTWADAREKAHMEALQSVVFAGEMLARDASLWNIGPDGCVGFDQHALYYSAHPDRWATLPLLRGDGPHAPPASDSAGLRGADDAAELEQLVRSCAGVGVQFLATELTTPDLWQIGLRVVRVLSPQLTPIHHHHRFPNLAGTTSDLHLRYPWAVASTYPSPHPHPLG